MYRRYQAKPDLGILDELRTFEYDGTGDYGDGDSNMKEQLFREGKLDQIAKCYWLHLHDVWEWGSSSAWLLCLFQDHEGRYVVTYLSASYFHTPTWTAVSFTFSTIREAVEKLKTLRSNEVVYHKFVYETIEVEIPTWSPEDHREICDSVTLVSTYNIAGTIRTLFIVFQDEVSSLSALPLELIFEVINEVCSNLIQ